MRGFYTDGNHNTEDSVYIWDRDGLEYIESADAYLVPEGWWEERYYGDSDYATAEIGDRVIGWVYGEMAEAEALSQMKPTEGTESKETAGPNLKTPERKNLEFFFGQDIKMASGKYFYFNRVQKLAGDNDDVVIILTKNIKTIKGLPVMLVAKDKGVYLKEWQVRKVASYAEGINCYAVRLTRKFYRVYEFKTDFEEYRFEGYMDAFDDVARIAKEQQMLNLKIREGWCR